MSNLSINKTRYSIILNPLISKLYRKTPCYFPKTFVIDSVKQTHPIEYQIAISLRQIQSKDINVFFYQCFPHLFEINGFSITFNHNQSNLLFLFLSLCKQHVLDIFAIFPNIYIEITGGAIGELLTVYKFFLKLILPCFFAHSVQICVNICRRLHN